jgi:hypothetical protein
MGRPADLTGKQFRRLTVIGPAGVHITPSGREHFLWRVRCSCSTELVVLGIALTQRGKASCGCLRAERLARRAERWDDLPSMTKRRVITDKLPGMTASQAKVWRALQRRRAARGEPIVTQPTATGGFTERSGASAQD